jgi:hypothetical protein
MAPDDANTTQTAERYRSFAHNEAGSSPVYREQAIAIADDADLLNLLAALPVPLRQPNLLFAAMRYRWGIQPDPASFRRVALEHADELLAIMRSHRTQTNEPARCSAWLPLLALLPQPLALLEVGASAGLCLLPDRYAYDYSGTLVGAPGSPVTFPCEVRGDVPVPSRIPDVGWRAGIDLNPLDLDSTADVAWLRALVWAGHDDRETRLMAAIKVAREDPPRVVSGNLLDALPALAAEVPPGLHLVVYHAAVMAYLTEPDRQRFAATVRTLDATWLAMEAPPVLASMGIAIPAGWDSRRDFGVARDGHLVAMADGHGRHLEWLPPTPV